MKLEFAFPDDYIAKVARTIFEPVLRGESTFCRFFPGHGMAVRLQQIFSDQKYLGAGFGEKKSRLVVVRVDAESFAVDPLQLFFLYVEKLLTDELDKLNLASKLPPEYFSRPAPPLVLTIQEIGNLCGRANDAGLDVVFVIEIGSHEQTREREFYSAWARIVEANLDHIHTHINSESRRPLDAGILPAVLIQSVVTVGLPDRREREYYLEYYLREWRMKLTHRQTDTVYNVCGHDTWFIKEALRIFRQGKQASDLLSDPNLLLKAKLQYELYGEREREVIEATLKTGRLPMTLTGVAKNLEQVNFWDQKHHIPRIIEQVVIQQQASGELMFDPKSQTLFLGPIDLSHKLSPLEHKILLRLYEHQGHLVSRDDMAKLIWGKEASEKYSDWAIDKAVSRVRSRLSLYTGLYQIKTRKKAGFLLGT